jgi:ketosteroid isomerase-like protein
MATAEEISRAYWRAEEAHDIEGVMRFYRLDSVFEAPGISLKGAEIRRFYEQSFIAFPKLALTVLHVFGDGAEACLEWRAAMTDTSGREHVVQGVNLAHVDEERFISLRAYFDRKALDIAGAANLSPSRSG